MELLKALRSGVHSLHTLETQLAIKIKRHTKHPNLVLLKYNQIESPMSDPIVRECRGLILDESNNWNPVSRPFDKFFNEGELYADTIDWSTARVQEKLDGSLIQVYHYDGEWHFGTSGTPDASGPLNSLNKTFNDLIIETWQALGYGMPSTKGMTYLFELMTPFNAIVVQHQTSRMVLIGLRDTATGIEFDVQSWKNDNYEKVREFPLGTLEDIQKSFDTFSGASQEGYVVRDAAFKRVKIKHPQYVALHHAIGSVSNKNLLEVIRKGESSEFLKYFPAWKEISEDIQSRYDSFVKEAIAEYEKIRHIEIQKDFAFEAKKTRHSSAMFQVRACKVPSFYAYYQNTSIDSLMVALGLKQTKEDEQDEQ